MLVSKMPNGKPEIYKAFQGEGATIGEPCVFVRLAGCNLQCKFCDTAYTWLFDKSKKSDYFEGVDRDKYVMEMSTEEVVDAIKKEAGMIRRVIFTGGEPLLQQTEIEQLVTQLSREDSWDFELETNGTIEISSYLFCHLERVNCSPKLSNSGNRREVSDRPEVIRSLRNYSINGMHNKVIYKFVVSSENDLQEIEKWQKKYGVIDSSIYLMPEGIDADKIKTGIDKLLKICAETGYKLSPRVHVLTYGNKRAV